MRSLHPPRAALLLGPVALAFASGGYDDGPRLVALAVAWLTLAAAVLAAPGARAAPPARAGRPAVVAVGALLLLWGWVALSRSWAPLKDAAGDDAERWGVYVAALAAAIVAFGDRGAARVVEPVAALGAFVVVGYGLAGRLVPWLTHEHASLSAGGRLEQPLTYWNAEGMLAALGVVLCARVAGDPGRPAAWRTAAAAVAVPLVAGVYLSFSRGAVAALLAGMLVLVVVAPTWAQLRSAAIALEAGVLGVAVCGASPAVRALHGSAASRDVQGALVLAGLLGAMALAAGLQRWSLRDEAEGAGRQGALALPRRTGWIALGAVVALIAIPVLVARGDGTGSTNPRFGAATARFGSAGSHRYAYWKAALQGFGEEPVRGVGSGGFAEVWLRRRHLPERIRDAHSLELEVLCELGLVGGLLLAALLGGVAWGTRRALAADPALAAGPAAALVVFGVHSALDWDWELPAVGLVAVVLAGTLLAHAARTPPAAV